MNRIEGHLIKYYLPIGNGFDLDGNGTLEPNEKVEDKNGDGQLTLDEYLSFVEQKSAILNYCVAADILREVEAILQFIGGLRDGYDIVNDTFDPPIEVILSQSPLLEAIYNTEIDNPDNFFEGRPSPGRTMKAVRKYFVALKENLTKRMKKIPARDRECHQIKENGFEYAYEKFAQDDDFCIERDEQSEHDKYLEMQEADRDGDGRVYLIDYLRYLGSRHSQDCFFTDGQLSLAMFLSGTESPQALRRLIDLYGAEPMLAFVDEADEAALATGAKYIIQGFSAFGYLIDSREDLDFVGRNLFAFVSDYWSNCYYLGYDDGFELAKAGVQTREDLELQLQGLSFLIERYEDNFSSYPEGDGVVRLVIDLRDTQYITEEHGVAPYVDILEQVESYQTQPSLSDFAEPEYRALVDEYGMEFFVELAKAARDGTHLLYAGLPQIKGLIDRFGKEVFLKIARDYGPSCGFLFNFCLPVVEDLIVDRRALIYYSSEFVKILRIFKEGGALFTRGSNPAEIAMRAASVFIEKYGIETLVRVIGNVADTSGVGTAMRLCFALDDPENFDLIDRIGIDPFIDFVEKAGREVGRNFDGLFRQSLPAISYLIQSEDDLEVVCNVLIDYAKEIEYTMRWNFFCKVAELKHLIQSPEDLRFVCNRLVEYSRVTGEDFSAFVDVLAVELVQSKEDLNRSAIFYFSRAIETSEEERIYIGLARLYLNEQNFSAALDTLAALKEFHPGSQKALELKFKIGVAVLLAGDATPVQRPRRFVLSVFGEVSEENPESALARRALLLEEALREPGFSLAMKTTYQGDGIIIQEFKGVDGLSLFFFDDPLFPEVVPGNVTVMGVGDETEVHILGFCEKFDVIYQKPNETIPQNNDGLLLAYQILPAEFFTGFENIVFTGDEYRISDFLGRSSPLGTTVLKLAHAWGPDIVLGKDGTSLELGALNKIYYDISWTPARIEREVVAAYSWKVGTDRSDFDGRDFIGDDDQYSMCNRRGDLDKMVQYFVTNAPYLRRRIRGQMEAGNFELAAKYLFVKYLMPFRGREYNLSDGSLGLELEEVQQKLDAWLAENPDTVESSTIETIDKIRRKYEESAYK